MANIDQDRTLFDYLEILRRRRGTALAAAAAVFGLAALYALGSRPVYRATATLDVEKPAESFTGGSSPYIPTEEDYLPTQAKLMASESALRSVYSKLELGKYEDFAGGLARLQGAVTVLPVPRTRLATISVESHDPILASMVAGALADFYLQHNLANQLFMSKTVLSELDSRSRGAGAKNFVLTLPAVATNPTVQGLSTQVVATEAELAKLRTTLKDDHPAVQSAIAQLALLRGARDAAVESALNTYRTELSGRLNANNARVVDPAETPDKPVRPRKQLALLIGLFGGLAAGFGAALYAESLDQSVRTHKDVEQTIGLPLLGHIPLFRLHRGEKIYAPLLAPEPTAMGEAFRSLRTMVSFAKTSDPEPFVLVTSAIQQEGKSFVAANLAVAAAQLGRKVLLVDGDLRRPSQHRLLGTAAERGLTEYLSGEVQDPAQLVAASEVAHLDVLPGGARAANASELLSGERLEALVSWIREHYDRVVIDCPPVFPVSDVLLWGRHIRSTILVARSGRTRVPLVQMACARLRNGGVDIIGGVINGARRGTAASADSHDFDRYYRRLARELPPPGEPA